VKNIIIIYIYKITIRENVEAYIYVSGTDGILYGTGRKGW